jgi:hypothetical protein
MMLSVEKLIYKVTMQTVLVNYWAVFAAAIASMALGMLWYGPVFGKKWQALMGFTEESMKSMSMTPMKAMALGLVGQLVMAYVLWHSLVFANAYFQASGASAGLMAGFWNWLGFIAPVTLGVVLWEGKSWTLWLLNGSYYLASLLLMGAILGWWM